MAQVIADMSMSLDGYIADARDGVKEVFAWLGSGSPDNAGIIEQSMADVGAVLTGRRTSDLAKAWRGQHPAGVPTFVISHRPPPDDLDAGTSTVFFVDDLEEAVRQAKDTAGNKAVAVAGGDVVRQLLSLGLLTRSGFRSCQSSSERGSPSSPTSPTRRSRSRRRW